MKTKLFTILISILLLSAILVRQAYSQSPAGSTEIIQSTAFNEVATAQFTPQTGWSFQYNINARFVNTSTTTGTVTMASSMATLSTGAGANQSATMNTIRKMRYLPGYGGLARFTAIFTTCTANSTQLIGVGDSENGFFFGCNGATFGVMRRNNSSDTWIAQSDWDASKPFGGTVDDNLDITKGNVYQIQFQWLGYGEIRFFVENPETGKMEQIHRIQYANANTTPSVLNPQLPLYAHVANTSNTSDIVLKTPSGIAGVEGYLSGTPHPMTLSNSQTMSKTVTTLVNVLTISNTATYASLTNAIQVQPKVLTLASDGNKSIRVSGYLNATIGGSPGSTAIESNNSVVYYDTAGTTITGGTLLFTVVLAKADGAVIDLTDFGVFLNPGDALTIGAFSDASNIVDVGLSWSELF